VRVPDSAILHREGEGLVVAQTLCAREPRAAGGGERGRRAATVSSKAVEYAKDRVAFGEPLARSRRCSFPWSSCGPNTSWCATSSSSTAWQMDRQNPLEISDMVSICNFRANRLCCEAADRAMQVHGGIGYSRAHAVRAHLPPPPPLPHHRGTEEVQIRRVAQYLFNFSGKRASSG
jgi:alkylation response protein AidB-like acyl-CoA dehydrogenase